MRNLRLERYKCSGVISDEGIVFMVNLLLILTLKSIETILYQNHLTRLLRPDTIAQRGFDKLLFSAILLNRPWFSIHSKSSCSGVHEILARLSRALAGRQPGTRRTACVAGGGAGRGE